MTYKYRVTLSGIKGFYRVYKISSESTLYSFHKQLRADLEFPADQLILFKGLDEAGAVVGRYGLFDLGSGAVDQVTMGQSVKAGIVSFVYFYDVSSRKSVNISFEGEIPEPCKSPEIIDSKGPLPIEFENGYVAFEDLPEDKRRLPGEESKEKKSLGDLLGISLDDLDDDEDDEEDEDYDEDEDGDGDEDAEELYDGEDVTL